MPTPSHHLNEVVGNAYSLAAVATTGTAGAGAILLAQLDLAAKVLALVCVLLNIVLVCLNLWKAARAKPRD